MRLPARILVVEDDDILAGVTAERLRLEGYEVFVAHDAEEARATPGAFEIGLFDIELPDELGTDLAADMLDAGVVLRAIFVTATLNRTLRARADALGMVLGKHEALDLLLFILADTLRQAGKV